MNFEASSVQAWKRTMAYVEMRAHDDNKEIRQKWKLYYFLKKLDAVRGAQEFFEETY